MNNIVPLFSVPLYVANLPQPSIEEYSYIQSIKYRRMAVNNGDISLDNYILENDIFSNLKNHILNRMNLYFHDVLSIKKDYEFYITNSWITKHHKGDFAQRHAHQNSLFSGTFYLDIPSDDESKFTLIGDKGRHLFPNTIKPNYKDYNIFNSESWSLTPKTGDLYIFPSCLEHETTKMTSESFRYCLAFNIFVKGKFEGPVTNDDAPIDTLILK